MKQFVGVSKLQADWVNDFDNGFVVVEASVSNPNDVRLKITFQEIK